MNNTRAVVAALHVNISKGVRYEGFGRVLLEANKTLTTLHQLNLSNHKEMYVKVTECFLQVLSENNLLPEPNRRGFLCNVENAVYPEVIRYVRELDMKKNRVRPSLAIGYEASLPTAICATRCDFMGPTTSLIDTSGGLQMLGFACNMIAEEQAELIVIAHIDRTYVEDKSDDFQGEITLAAVMNPKACKSVKGIGFIRDWGWTHCCEKSNGTNLKDFMTWLQNRLHLSQFVANQSLSEQIWFTTVGEGSERK
ncbi:hypothetical protein ACVWY7_002188 [Bacillus sp. TE9106W]|nr:hypothetical protein [Bacillus cereus]